MNRIRCVVLLLGLSWSGLAWAQDDGSTVTTNKRCSPKWSKRVQPNFRKVKLLEMTKWIAERTCYNFLIKGTGLDGQTVTLISEKPMSLRSVYSAFLATLQAVNIVVVKKRGYRQIMPARDIERQSTPTYLGGRFRHPRRDEMVTYMLRVKYIDANQLRSVLFQLKTPSGRLFAFVPANVLLIIDFSNNIHRLLRIARQLDIEEANVKEKIRMIEVENGQAQEIVQRLQSVFQVIPRNRLRRGQQIDERFRLSKILADERTNRIILVCSKQSYTHALALIKKLDQPLADGGSVRVHHLRYAKAEEIAQTLSQLAQGNQRRRVRRRRTTKKSASATAADLFQGEVRITADRGTNSLVIVASQRDYGNLMRVIRRLDVRRKQVFIEAVILEVSLTKSRDLGAVFHGGLAVGDSGNQTVGLFGTQLGGVNSVIFDPAALMGLALGLRGPDIPGSEGLFGEGTPALPSFGVILRALQSNTDVDIISTPHLLTTTNEEASIQVGQNVPFIAGTSFSAGAGVSIPVRNIQRQDVALTLNLKPQINAGDRVKMDMDLEITEIAGQDPDLGPTTTKRKVKTTIHVKDNQTVVIGGLMRDKVSHGVSKVPLLGDIPLLGALFRVKKRSVEKQNLLIFLTPHIILNPKDFRRIFLKKMKERKEFLKNFYARKFRKRKDWTAPRLTGGLVDRMKKRTQDDGKQKRDGLP